MDELVNIINNFDALPIINSSDKYEIKEMIADLITEFIAIDPLCFQYENFDLTLNKQVFGESKKVLAEIYKEDTDDELRHLVNKTVNTYFTYIQPRRSYNKSVILYTPNLDIIKSKLDYLINVPQPDQRTEEWYLFRHKYLTASSIWKAFSSLGHVNQLIYSKCKSLDIEKYKQVNLDSPLHWGQKYEDVSIMWYENNYKTKIRDFGCIKHSKIDYLAASPDGINVDPASKRYGRMLEIKNIVNRDINQIPKFEYWIQMQVQMEVCDLNECDFLETRFKEYDSYIDFNKDGTFQLSSDNKQKGICVLFFDKEQFPHYEYSPWNCTEKEYLKWNNDIISKNKEKTWFKNLYWKLDEVSVVLVVRNKIWFKAANLLLDNIWKQIEEGKKNGCEQRAPQKRVKKNNESKPRCLINLDTKNENNVQFKNIVFNIDTS